VSRFVDEHRGRFGVEPICSTLGVSASAYYQRSTGERSVRAVEDEWLLGRIEAVHGARGWRLSVTASTSAAIASSG
jgi:putative transposase